MRNKFQTHFHSTFSDIIGKRCFVAVSGGLDSMVLLHLLQSIDFSFAILHCNFQLRGDESEADMNFVVDYANKFDIPSSVGHFETYDYAKENKVSIQVAARDLRYEWFFEQLEEKEFDFIMTAHHADDNLETFLINLSRGTGLDGLVGIPEEDEALIRPLLPFSRQEIEEYAKENNIKWREDSSNESDAYFRNKIRHHVVPTLKEINPQFLDNFIKTNQHLKQVQSMVEDAKFMMFGAICTMDNFKMKISISELLKLENYKIYLYYWLKSHEFTDWDSIYDLVYAENGKKIVSEYSIITKDRNFLVVEPIYDEDDEDGFILIDEDENSIDFPLNIEFSDVNEIGISDKNTIFVNKDALTYPLEIRKWTTDDFFFPIGLGGKKKVSKFLKDEKIEHHDKQNAWLLCSGDRIVWVIGMRQDHLFRVTERTEQILKIELKP